MLHIHWLQIFFFKHENPTEALHAQNTAIEYPQLPVIYIILPKKSGSYEL